MNLVDHPVSRAVNGELRERGGDLVVAVSGGADSVALLRALMIQPRPRRRIVVAHLDHQLRASSPEDAIWVERLAETLGLPVHIERQDVAARGAEEGMGLEEAARRCRYEFLARIAAEQDCRWIAMAHTADDQAETVLHHLLRGTGLPGLRGMPPARPLEGSTLLRPLLSVSRADVIDFLQRLGQPFLTDETNLEVSYTRNRIRHVLLPALREQFNPQVEAALCRLAQQVRDVQDLIDELATELLRSALRESAPERVELDIAPLRSAPRHLVREALRVLFVQHGWPRGRIGFVAWDELAELAQTAQAPKSLTLPEGMMACYRRGVLTIARG